MSSIWDLTLRDFLERTASHTPTPGGGSVAAVSAADGLALVLMALEVNLRRKEPHPEVPALLAKGKSLLELVKPCADEDIKVFGTYMTAIGMPKGTPAEEQERSRALALAAGGALEAPLRAAELYLEGLSLARDAMGAVHSGIASDVGAGAALLYGALTATLYNVDINLRGLEVPAHRTEALSKRRDLQRRADELAYVIQKETAAKIAK